MSDLFNVSFELHGHKVDLKYYWPIGAAPLRKAVEQDIGLLDMPMVQLMMRIVRPGDFVVDGGASIGYFTVLLSKLVGPQGKVIAIEPDPNSVAFIEKNIEANELDNVTVIPKALWSVAHISKKFYLAEYSHANSLSPEEPGCWPIDVMTTCLLQYSPARLVKLDIEGAEYDTLHWSCQPQSMPYIICELNNVALPRFNTTAVELRKMMYNQGYDTYLISDEGLPVLLTPHQGVVVNRTDINVLFSTPQMVAMLRL